MSHYRSRADVPPPQVEEVADGVFAHVQLDGSWGLNNSGFLVGPDSVTVIDTTFTERRARALREAIGAVTPLPPRTLVNTHHHGDHTWGNVAFRDTTIIAHDLARPEMLATGLIWTHLWTDVEWGDIAVVPPTVTFGDRLSLYAGDLKVELLHVGPAHTTNDVVAWIPERGILFTGDVVFSGGTPFVLMGSVAGSLDALDRLRALGARTIVPGHGPVCGPEIFATTERYLRWIQETARKGIAADLPALEAARQADLGEYAAWLDSERLVGNLHRAYAEEQGGSRGAPLDVMAVVGEMIAYNGGRIPPCLA